MSTTSLNCPNDCTSPLAAAEFNYCDADTNHGEVDQLLMAAADAAPIVNIEDLAEWLTRINQTSADVDAFRRLNVIMEKPAAEGEMENLGGGYEKPKPATHTLTGRIVETGDTNYNFIRTLQCGGRYTISWTAGKYIYGTQEAKVSARLVTPLEKTENEYFQVTITYEDIHDPARGSNPFA